MCKPGCKRPGSRGDEMFYNGCHFQIWARLFPPLLREPVRGELWFELSTRN